MVRIGNIRLGESYQEKKNGGCDNMVDFLLGLNRSV